MSAIDPIAAGEPESKSADLVAENLATLKALFPQAFGEAGVDFDVLRQLLGDAVDDGDERYGLNWSGKRQARRLALTPSLGTLRPAKDDSVDWDTTKNLMIEGDNLEVLKLLQKSYAGQVKLIYIDPPYNTGKDFVYPDDYVDSIGNYMRRTGQTDIGGAKLTSNPESSGRYHTDWLNMMMPRLMACKSLLSDRGAIFISVDDREVSNLKLLSDSIFGQENFVCIISVVNNLKGRNDRRHIATAHESMLFYAQDGFVSYGLPLTEEQRAAFKFKDESGRPYALRDLRKRGGPDRREDRPNMYFPIFWDANTGECSLTQDGRFTEVAKPMRGDGTDGRWRWGKETVAKHLSWLHARYSKKNGKTDIEHRVYLDPSISVGDPDDGDDSDESGIERSAKPKSIWLGGSFSSDTAKRVVKNLGLGDAFDTPKALDHILNVVTLATRDKDIVLDFFAGSGTTGHAVMAQNAADGGQRRYILVQLPEPLDPSDKDQKAAAAFCDAIGKPRNIAELTKERLRRAAAKVKEDNPEADFDGGFRVYKLATSNLKAWVPGSGDLQADIENAIDNLVPGRTEDDLLVELLLKQGIDLTEAMVTREIVGREVHAFGHGAMVACLADVSKADADELANRIADWVQELSPPNATTFFFKDAGFEDNRAKANLAAILEQRLGDRLLKVRSL